MSDWFVVNVAEPPPCATRSAGWPSASSRRATASRNFGINLRVLEPGQPAAVYHAESVQEGFLVLSGECVVIIDGEERTLRAWDFVHCPAGTAHVFVGAGDGPCAILMIGARRPDQKIPTRPTTSPRATAPRSRRTPTRPPRPTPSGARTSRPPSSTGRRAEVRGHGRLHSPST